MKREMDLYSDYLLSSFGQVTATGLSNLLNGSVSHDKITRILSESTCNSKDLWQEVKPLVRKYEREAACLIFDDTIVSKPYTDENELKTIRFCEIKTREEKRQSPVTKNEMMHSMLKQAVEKQHLKFRYVLADSRFSSSDNLLFSLPD
jgi:hypothetical protein